MSKHSIHVDPSQEQQDLVQALKKSGLDYTLEEPSIIPTYRAGKKKIHLVPKKGESMDTCATIHDDYICCNVKVLKSVSNCPFDCSYCFLQNYLNDGTTKIISDHDALFGEVKEKCTAEPNRLFRIGTWELGDSLALEDTVGQAQQLIPAFSTLDNAILELKTKSDCVDPILNCDHKHKTVVSWSMNSDYIINKQEHKTASLKQRLAALKKVTDAGYLVGLHYDPVIYHQNWKQGYTELIEQCLEHTKPEQIAWISLGSLRFNPEMKKKIEANFPASDITYAEMVQGNDGKVRYVKPLRVEMYEHILSTLKRCLNVTSLSPLDTPQKTCPCFTFVWSDGIFGIGY